MNISVLGSGSFGTAIANHIASQEYSVLLWSRRECIAEGIRLYRRNQEYFGNTELSPNLLATSTIDTCIQHSQRILLALPAQSLRSVLERIPLGAYRFLNLAKGIEIASGMLLHQVVREIQPQSAYSVLSGPSHAEEIIRGKPTAVVVASSCLEQAREWQQILNARSLRVYTGEDVIGVEVGGAVKNVIAIAVGIARGMHLGDNAIAALATRGLAEIMRLGKALKGDPLTLMGLAGVGDLMVTCYSMHSRNIRFGLAIGEGKNIEEAAREVGQVVEGAFTTQALIRHAREMNVEIPITQGVYDILYAGASIQETMERLLSRDPKPEI